jgi:hypothetical protein
MISRPRHFIAPDCGQIGQGSRQKLGGYAAAFRATGLIGHRQCPLKSGITCNLRVLEFGSCLIFGIWAGGVLSDDGGDPMRVAVIVVSALMVATPSEASKSCMSKTEARQHFGSVHIYWHGAEHCWDATSTRWHHQIHQVQQKKIDQSKWHDAMSEMLADGESASAPTPRAPAPTSWVDRWVDLEQSPIVSRWVDIVQVAAPLVIRESEPMVTPRGLVMVIMFITLTLAIVVIVERPPSRRNRRS